MILRPIWLLGAALLMIAALSAPAQAEGDAKAARTYFQRAEAAYNLGKFDEALAGYQAAYEAKSLPGLLFNIAQCHRNLNNHERALFFYRRYLALDPETKNRAVVEQLIAESEKRRDAQPSPPSALAPPPLVAAPPAAPVPLPPAAPEPAAASPDRHQASAPPSHLPDLLPAAAPAEEVPPAFVKATPVPSSDRPLYSRWGFWAVIGGVAVAGAATAVLLGSRHGASAPPSGGLGTIDWR